MESTTENGASEILGNQKHDVTSKDEKPSEKPEEPTQGTSNIITLHDDVRKYIENYIQQQGYNDVTMTMESATKPGDNYVGILGRLTITGVNGNNKKKTFNWIAKAAPTQEMYRMMINVSIIYERESYIYEKVFKAFRDIQIEKRILEPFNQYPEFILYYSENMKETIIMEDMKSKGFIMRENRQEPLDFNHVKLAIKAYAKLHAMSYVLKDQKPDVFKNIAENTKDIVARNIMIEPIQQANKPLMANALSVLDPIQHSKIIPVFKKFIDNYMDIIRKLVVDTNDYSVIGHGDCWVNNMMWKYNETNSNVPTNVCLLDWQQARYGSLACDLSYFFFTCTSKEFRDKHYDDMIKLYYYTLCVHMNDLGSDPQKYLPFEALQEELKKYSLLGLFTCIPMLFLIGKEAGEIPEFSAENLDLEAIQGQWMKFSENLGPYNAAVRGAILDCYDKGYFSYLS